MNKTNFFIDDNLPFLELRYSKSKLDYKEHTHDSLSIGAIVEGSRLYTNKNNSYVISKNHLAVVNPNTIHSCNSINNGLTSYYMLYLQKEYIEAILESNYFLNFDKELIEDEKCFNEFIKLCEVLFTDEFYLRKEQLLINFITNLYTKNSNLNQKYLKNDLKKSKLIIDYLKEKIKDNITLDELSTKFNISKFHLIKLFKKESGTTIYSYFINLKIEYAKKLLKQNMPITNVALECGFFDQSHFHRNFLKIVAITPKQYQNNFVQ